jgi:hypothetical protein
VNSVSEDVFIDVSPLGCYAGALDAAPDLLYSVLT